MTSQKRTFSLPEELSRDLDAAAAGNASSFVAAALREKLARDATAARLRAAYGDPDPTALEYWVSTLSGATGTRGGTTRTEGRRLGQRAS